MILLEIYVVKWVVMHLAKLARGGLSPYNNTKNSFTVVIIVLVVILFLRGALRTR
jgi:hypothetical protein